MALIDFPNPPLTAGQLYAAPSGITYRWDGATWIVGVGPEALLWEENITPTVVPGSTTNEGPLVEMLAAPAAMVAGNTYRFRTSGTINKASGGVTVRLYASGAVVGILTLGTDATWQFGRYWLDVEIWHQTATSVSVAGDLVIGCGTPQVTADPNAFPSTTYLIKAIGIAVAAPGSIRLTAQWSVADPMSLINRQRASYRIGN